MKQTRLWCWLAVLLTCLPASVMGMSLEAQQKETQDKALAMIAEQAKQWANIQTLIKQKKSGDAFLDIVQNKTPYDASFTIAGETAMEKKLRKGAIVRIKSLQKGYEGKYYTFTNGVFMPTTNNPNDKTTLFGVDRFADILLNEWFGIKATDNNYLQCAAQGNQRRLVTPDAGSADFTNLFKQDAHFQIMGSDIAIEPKFENKISRIVDAKGGFLHMVKYLRKEPAATLPATPVVDTPQQLWSIASNLPLSSLAAANEANCLRYNMPVAIRTSEMINFFDSNYNYPGDVRFRDRPYMASNIGAAPCEVFVGQGWAYYNPSAVYTPCYYFILRKADNATTVGTVHYGDTIEIIAAAPRADCQINPKGAKICVAGRDNYLSTAIPDDYRVAQLTDGTTRFRLLNPDNLGDTSVIPLMGKVRIESAASGYEGYQLRIFPQRKWYGGDWSWKLVLLHKDRDPGQLMWANFVIEQAPPQPQTGHYYPARFNDTYNQIVQAFGLNNLQATTTFKDGQAVGIGFNLAQMAIRFQRNQDTKEQGKFEAWGIAISRSGVSAPFARTLVQRNDDGSWRAVLNDVRWVALGADQGVFYVDNNYCVWRQDGANARQLSISPLQLVQVAGQVKNNKEWVWAIGADARVYFYTTQKTVWTDANFNGRAVSIAMGYGTANPIVFVADDGGNIWTCDAQAATWAGLGAPPSGAAQVAASIPAGNTPRCCYAVGRDNNVYYYNGSQWSGALVNGRNFATVMNGFYMTNPISTYKLVQYEKATTANIPYDPSQPLAILGDRPKDDKEVLYNVDGSRIANPASVLRDRKFVNENDLQPDVVGADASVSIELLQPGTGGSLNAGNQFVFGRFPIKERNPDFQGYAYVNVPGFTAASLLSLNPMRGKGAAWISQALQNPGNATISFLARSAGGGIHVAFDAFTSQREPRFHWRVVIGGSDADKTKKSWIEKGTINSDGQFISVRVCEVTADENPLAAGSAGSFAPYTISIDDGLILVGMGGTIFMAWRDPDATYPVNYVGFGTDNSVVDYMQIQVLPPMVAIPPTRLFAQAKETVNVSPDGTITWVDYPFRIADEGAIAFAIQGDEKVGVALGQDKDSEQSHYLITFGDVDDKGNNGISVKKWLPEVGVYLQRAFLPSAAYEAMKKQSNVDPTKALSFVLDSAKKLNAWVSYKDGQIFVGLGDAKHIGSNVLMVVTDLNQYTGIQQIGFGVFGEKPATISNIAVADNVTLNFEKAEELYKVPTTQLSLKGALDVIRPVDFQLQQVEDRVVVHDAIANKNYIVAAMPDPSKNYTWMFVVNPDGSPSFQKSKDSDASDVKIAYDQLVTQADAQVALVSAQQDSIKASGDLAHKLGQNASAEEKAQADAIASTNDIVNKAAATTIESTGKTPITANAGMGIGVAMMAVSTVTTSILANQKLNEAAASERAGADAAVAAEARAQTLADALALTKYQQALAAGDANAAFQGADRYVYTDTVTKESAGSLSVSPEAQANAKVFATKVTAAAKMGAVTAKNIDEIVSTMQEALDAVTNIAVVQDATVKKSAYKVLDAIAAAYPKLLAKAADDSPVRELYNDVITLLFTAYNNIVLADVSVAAEKKEKSGWYAAINYIARAVLADPKNETFVVDAWYGEYVWLPTEFETPDRGSISFSAKGGGDLFIGLTSEATVVRNVQPPVGMYEVVFNGYNATTTGVRFENLGKLVASITNSENKLAAFNEINWRDYWVNFDNGKIEIGTGALDPKNVILTCVDRYPVGGFNTVGISSWDNEVEIKNIVVGRSMYQEPAAKLERRPTTTIAAVAKVAKTDVAKVVATREVKLSVASTTKTKITLPKGEPASTKKATTGTTKKTASVATPEEAPVKAAPQKATLPSGAKVKIAGSTTSATVTAKPVAKTSTTTQKATTSTGAKFKIAGSSTPAKSVVSSKSKSVAVKPAISTGDTDTQDITSIDADVTAEDVSADVDMASAGATVDDSGTADATAVGDDQDTAADDVVEKGDTPIKVAPAAPVKPSKKVKFKIAGSTK